MGDFLRFNHWTPYKWDSKVTYQYMMRRVAYLDDSGSLVETSACDELQDQATRKPPSSAFCCGFGACNMTKEEYFDYAYSVMSHTQVVNFAPKRAGAAAPKQIVGAPVQES